MPTAMVWGATGGIGHALVEALIEADWTIITVSRNAAKFAELETTNYEADVGDEFAVKQAVMAAAQAHESVDLWIFAVGDISTAPVADMASEDWQRLITANLTGAYLATHHSLPLLQEDATLVYLGAISERLQLPGLSAYAAAKHALEAFTVALGKEERKRTILTVRPAAVDTPLWSKVDMRLPKQAKSPQACAKQILDAVEEGKSGLVDLT